MTGEPIIEDQWPPNRPNSEGERNLATDYSRECNSAAGISKFKEQKRATYATNILKLVRQQSFASDGGINSEKDYQHKQYSPGTSNRDPHPTNAIDKCPDIRGGFSSPRIPTLLPESHTPCNNSPRFVSLCSSRPLPSPTLSLDKCYVAPPLRTLRSENNLIPRNDRSIGDLLSLRMRQPEERDNFFSRAIQSYESFDSLVKLALSHPIFPLLFRGVFAAVNGNAPSIVNVRSEMMFRQVEEKAEHLQISYGRTGMQNQHMQPDEIDLLFTALYGALKSLQSEEHPPITVPLYQMMCACGNLEGTKRAKLIPHSSLPMDKLAPAFPLKYREQSRSARWLLENWLNENYQNPYPTREQKLKLARECKMTLEQVR